MRTRFLLALLCGAMLVAPAASALAGGLGTRVFVVERATGSLAVYDYQERRLFKKKIKGLGNLRHATMIFTPDLERGFLATRNGKVSRINLRKMEKDGEVFTSDNSIDNAVSQDGRTIAVAEYFPGGVTILDADTMQVLRKIPGNFERDGRTIRSRVTGIVDAPGNRYVCSLIEGSEIWIIDASQPNFPVEHRIPTTEPMPYDAMITPDGRYYIVVHLGLPRASVLDLTKPEEGVRVISLEDPTARHERDAPVKLPHVASWAVAGDWCFVPLVGEKRLAVLNRHTWEFERSIPLRGHPVYSVKSPTGREVWVSFSGEEDDAYLQIVDTEKLEVVDELRVGRRVYHLDFTPRGSHVLVSANRDNKLVLVDAHAREIVDEQHVESPSGIFGLWRAFRLGL